MQTLTHREIICFLGDSLFTSSLGCVYSSVALFFFLVFIDCESGAAHLHNPWFQEPLMRDKLGYIKNKT